MIFCDRCNEVVSHQEHCTFEQRDYHPLCLETIRTAKLMREFAEWYDRNGTPDVNAAENALTFFGTWLEIRGVRTGADPDDPRPPLRFPSR